MKKVFLGLFATICSVSAFAQVNTVPMPMACYNKDLKKVARDYRDGHYSQGHYSIAGFAYNYGNGNIGIVVDFKQYDMDHEDRQIVKAHLNGDQCVVDMNSLKKTNL